MLDKSTAMATVAHGYFTLLQTYLCVLPALGLAGCLVQGISEDEVLLLQSGQLNVGAVLQLFLQSPDLFQYNRQLAKHTKTLLIFTR